jgi:16S rRNA (adenine1518-N6/adenine1519-N6)-dimethyltransferase
MRCVESLAEKPTDVLPRRIGGGCFLIQLEVAERIASGPGSKNYGVLSVLLQSRFTTTLVHKVPRGAFWPVPDVDGGVIALRPHDRVAKDVPFEHLRTTVRAAFQQRRKTLRNALLANLKDKDVDGSLATAGLDPKTRAEQVDVDGFVRLARALFAA